MPPTSYSVKSNGGNNGSVGSNVGKSGCVPISSKDVCFQSTQGEANKIKVGVQSTDCDPGASDPGQQLCVTNRVNVGATISSVTGSATNASITTTASFSGNTAFLETCWTNDGNTTPSSDLELVIVTDLGTVIVNTDKMSGFSLCKNEDGTELLDTESEPETITLKKICYDGCPTKYQDDDGNEVDVSKMTPTSCPVPITCTLDILTACDVTDDGEAITGITREIENCSDGTASTTFYTNYGESNQQNYELVNGYVDCSSLIEISFPEPEKPTCEDWEIVNVWNLTGENGVNKRVHSPITGQSATTNASDIFNENDADGNGLPDINPALNTSFTEVVETDLLVLDSNNGRDATEVWTYIYLDQPVMLREYRATAETIDYYSGECCATPTLSAHCDYSCSGATRELLLGTLPAGIHFVGFQIFDLSFWSGLDVQYSTNSGVSWARVPSSWLYKDKPVWQKCELDYCPETGVYYDGKSIVPAENIDRCTPTDCNGSLASSCIKICPEPCGDFIEESQEFKSLCTESKYDTIRTTVCNEDIITFSEDFELVEKEEECLLETEWKLAANDVSSTGSSSWASGYYTTDCPLWAEDVCKCATVEWSAPNSLFMFGLSDDQVGSWTGDLIFYVYHWSNGTTIRKWLRAYSDTGGWLTGWLDQGVTTQSSDICLQRSGTVETWMINGAQVATSTGNTNPLYCWSSPYTNATNTWSTGTHAYSGVTFCPDACSKSIRIKSAEKELSNSEAFKILKSDGLSDSDIQLVVNPLGWRSEFTDINECLIEHTLKTNASKFKVKDLRAYGMEVLGLSKEQVSGNEPQVIELLQGFYGA